MKFINLKPYVFGVTFFVFSIGVAQTKSNLEKKEDTIAKPANQPLVDDDKIDIDFMVL